jgi:hypothetical protein
MLPIISGKRKRLQLLSKIIIILLEFVVAVFFVIVVLGMEVMENDWADDNM